MSFLRDLWLAASASIRDGGDDITEGKHEGFFGDGCSERKREGEADGKHPVVSYAQMVSSSFSGDSMGMRLVASRGLQSAAKG